MKYIRRNDFLYASVFVIFSMFIGVLFYADGPSAFYEFPYYNYLEKDVTAVMFIAMWAFPKVLAILYLVQYFITNYETCYIYFKIRNQNGNLWFYHIFKSSCAKLLIFSMAKLLIMVPFIKDFDLTLMLYEFVYILLFAFIYNSLYLLIRHEKTVIYLVIGHLLLMELAFLFEVQVLESYLFMADINILNIAVILMLLVATTVIFNYVLKYKSDTNGGRTWIQLKLKV